MKIKVGADMKWARRIVQNVPGARQSLCEAVLRSAEPYVPYDTGYLMSTGTVAPASSGVTYGAPYARRMYYHDGAFSKRTHRLAGPRWVERAKDSSSDEWERVVSRELMK